MFSFVPVLKKARRSASTIDEEFFKYYGQVYNQSHDTVMFWREYKEVCSNLNFYR